MAAPGPDLDGLAVSLGGRPRLDHANQSVDPTPRGSRYQQLLHSSDLQSHPCNYCEKVFVTPSYLLSHLERRHPGHAPFAMPASAAEGGSHRARAENTAAMRALQDDVQRLQDEVRLARQQMAAEVHNTKVQAEMQKRAEEADRQLLFDKQARQQEDTCKLPASPLIIQRDVFAAPTNHQ